jgi:hypothetical protein
MLSERAILEEIAEIVLLTTALKAPLNLNRLQSSSMKILLDNVPLIDAKENGPNNSKFRLTIWRN